MWGVGVGAGAFLCVLAWGHWAPCLVLLVVPWRPQIQALPLVPPLLATAAPAQEGSPFCRSAWLLFACLLCVLTSLGGGIHPRPP